jgi:hypothetical protein
MKHLSALFAIVLLTASSQSAPAQDRNDAMKKCAQMTDKKERLTCFDQFRTPAAGDTVKDVPKQAKQATSAPIAAEVDMVDFLVDGKQWLKKKVVVTGCELAHVGNISTCHSPAGFFFVTTYANKEDLRETMRKCTGGTRCPVTISGIVGTYGGSLALSKAEITRE